MQHTDNNSQIGMAVLDKFSKAVDTVPYDKVIVKLQHYGIQCPILNWISIFLKSRDQHVMVDGEKSPPVKIDSGVPQGTVLGPLIFLLHINDVTTTTRLLADDCLLYRVIRTMEYQIALQKDLDALVEWEKSGE